MSLVDQDQEHLRLLSLFHYVWAAITALFGCFAILPFAIGLTTIVRPEIFAGKGPPPAFMGYLFTLIGGAMMLVGWTMAVCTFLAGRFLAKRRKRLFCMVIAGLNCGHAPLGTALGVFTLIVLVRPTVKAMFEAPQN